MIAFRDMTFCPYYRDCAKRETCPRPLTPEVEEQARKWWGGDDPLICVWSVRPGCHVLDKGES